MATASPSLTDPKHKSSLLQLSDRIHKCWSRELNWDLLPTRLNKVRVYCTYTYIVLPE